MATASAYQTAIDLFHGAYGNATRIASIQSAFDGAWDGALTKGGMDSINSASKNNISMQKLVGLSEPDRIRAMRWALKWLDAGICPSSRTLASIV